MEKGAAGKYAVTLTERRTATAEDRAQLAKQALMEQAQELSRQVISLHRQGRYRDAVPLAERALQSAKTPRVQVKKLARSLDERVMRPVRRLLGLTKRVFLAPDGALNLVPFAALVNEDGKYLVEEYDFNYLTSGRDLLHLQVAGESQEAPAIVANPFFDMKSAAAAKANGRRAIGLLGAGETAAAEVRATEFTALYYPPLTGTAAEAKSIGALLPQARVWTQADATEATLKTVNRPRILHIATHGFFLPDQPQAAPTDTGFSQPSLATGPQQENPMLRSGLILAGVIQKQSGVGEDGVLTAQEAAGLNLFGTKSARVNSGVRRLS